LQPETAPTSDNELLRAVARGEESALAEVYDRYRLILFGLIVRIVHSREEAEDVLQEVFLQIWRRAADFDEGRGRAFTWLVTVARSRALDRLRSLGSRARLAEAAPPPEQIGDAAADAFHSEQAEVVRRALARIPIDQRQALFLGFFEGLTQSEIAARLGAPLGTVKTRMRAGMTKLRELLQEQKESAY
jgi:RNA polymerase sigma-70 factor (ECF subfamily)